jgi:hypothetical protein
MLCPPHLAANAGVQGLGPFAGPVERVYAPFIASAAAAGVRHVALLSVQTAGRRPRGLHARVEAALRASGLAWTAVRPAWYFQNLLRPPLLDMIRDAHAVELPAGRAELNWAGGPHRPSPSGARLPCQRHAPRRGLHPAAALHRHPCNPMGRAAVLAVRDAHARHADCHATSDPHDITYTTI